MTTQTTPLDDLDRLQVAALRLADAIDTQIVASRTQLHLHSSITRDHASLQHDIVGQTVAAVSDLSDAMCDVIGLCDVLDDDLDHLNSIKSNMYTC